MKIKYRRIQTSYWSPQQNSLHSIVNNIDLQLQDHDIIVLSEKALSTAMGNVVDESKIKPGRLAKLIVIIWIKVIWGYFLSRITRLSDKNRMRLKKYPVNEGSRHKQLIITRLGLLHSLKHWSEGGVDATNLPLNFVSLPLKDPQKIASKIRYLIIKRFKKKVTVIIADSDKTFTYGNLHITSRNTSLQGIHNLGPIAFILGRFLMMRTQSTPIAISTQDNLNLNMILNLTALANRSRGTGAGRTIWDIASRFKTDITDVTLEMLEKIPHYPIMFVRLYNGTSRP